MKLLNLGYRQEKVRLNCEDLNAEAPIWTVWKWGAEQAVYQAVKQQKHFWEVTARQGQAWACTSSQDVVPNHKVGEERVGDLRSNQNWGQDIQGHRCKLMTREVDKLGRNHQRSHNVGRPCKEIEIPN